MEPQKLKFAKRKLRVQRCKTLPGSTLPKSFGPSITSPTLPEKTTSKSAKSTAKFQHNAIPKIPKGDPSTGEKLRTMSKQERKVAKSADPNRVARRLAKKKARNALQRQGVQMTANSKGKGRNASSKIRPSTIKPKQM